MHGAEAKQKEFFETSVGKILRTTVTGVSQSYLSVKFADEKEREKNVKEVKWKRSWTVNHTQEANTESSRRSKRRKVI